jgi:hypothetical protein
MCLQNSWGNLVAIVVILSSGAFWEVMRKWEGSTFMNGISSPIKGVEESILALQSCEGAEKSPPDPCQTPTLPMPGP